MLLFIFLLTVAFSLGGLLSIFASLCHRLLQQKFVYVFEFPASGASGSTYFFPIQIPSELYEKTKNI